MAMTTDEAQDLLPWYRQFWPWFIIALPAASVVAGLTTVWISVVNRDALVSDDWYKDGTAINQRLDRREHARELGVVASLDLSRDDGIALVLGGAGVGAIERLRLELRHPTLQARDRNLLLERRADGVFWAALDQPIRGRWYATLEPAGDGTPSVGGSDIRADSNSSGDSGSGSRSASDSDNHTDNNSGRGPGSGSGSGSDAGWQLSEMLQLPTAAALAAPVVLGREG